MSAAIPPRSSSCNIDEARKVFEQGWALSLHQPDRAIEIADTVDALARDAQDSTGQRCAQLLRLRVLARHEHDPLAVQAEAGGLRNDFVASGEDRFALCALMIETSAMADCGRVDEAISLIHDNLDKARSLLGLDDLGRLFNLLGAILSECGRNIEAARIWYEALEHFGEDESPPSYALVTLNIGALYMRLGNFAAAEDFLRKALQLVEAQGIAALGNISLGNLGYDLVELGRGREAIEILDAMAPGAPSNYDLKEYAFLQIVRAEAFSAVGNLEAARARLDEVEALGERAMDPPNWRYERVARLRLLRREGRLDEALSLLRQAESETWLLEDPIFGLHLLDEGAGIFYARGELRTAYERAVLHLKRSREIRRQGVEAECLSLRTRHELRKATLERDDEIRRRAAADKARTEIEGLNQQLALRVSEIERLQNALREQAIRDPLTGLFNRRVLFELIPAEIARSDREQRPLSLVLLDADNFKAINDQHGHAMGDAVLVALAGVLDAGARCGATVARYGGEEFCVVFPGFTPDRVKAHLTDWLTDYMASRMGPDGSLSGCSFSAGVARLRSPGTPTERTAAMLQAADRALYRAKAAGRARIEIAPEREEAGQ